MQRSGSSARAARAVCGQRVQGSDSWADFWAAVAWPVLGSEGMETSLGETCSAASRGGEKLCKGVEQLLTCLPVREEVQMGGKDSKDGRREGVREILHRDIQHKMLHHL